MLISQAEAVIGVNQGLFLGRTPINVPQGGLQDGMNFRIKQGRIGNYNLGWEAFSAVNFQNPILLIERFEPRGISGRQIIATKRDIFNYDRDADTAVYLNPRYEVGTIDVSGTAVTVASGVPAWLTNEVKAGDFISIGATGRNSLSATWIEITAVTNTTLTLISTGGSLSGQAYTIRRTFAGDDEDGWQTSVYVNPDDGTGDDLWFATNGVDWVLTWDGSATQLIRRSAFNFRCRYLEVYKGMMLYAHLLQSGSELPNSFINSNVGNPLDVTTGLSEQFRTHDSTDPIRKVKALGDNVVFYCEKHVILAQFVGDPFVFIFRTVTNDIGLIGTRLVADFGDYHEFIGQDAQYLFDGVTVNEIGSHVWREVLRTRDPTRQQMGFTFFDETNGELIWAICLTSDANVGVNAKPPEVAFVEHYLEMGNSRVPTPYSKRKMPFYCAGQTTQIGVLTWDELTDTWDNLAFRWNDVQLFSGFPLLVVGNSAGALKTLNTVHTIDGASLTPTYVLFNRRPLGDRRIRGLLRRIYPFATPAAGTMDVTVQLMDHPAGAVSIIDTQEFDLTLPQGGHFTSHFRRGRYFETKIGSDGTPWEISGYDADISGGGTR